MHSEAYAFVQAVAPQRPPGLVLEIGGRNINGTIRDLFTADRYVSVDVLDGPGVDVVANGATYQPPEPPACIVCCEVLEHTPSAGDICQQAFDVLAPDGLFIVTTAMDPRAPHSARDGGPILDGEYYRNVSEALLRGWLHPFAWVDVQRHQSRGDIYAVARKGAA